MKDKRSVEEKKKLYINRFGDERIRRKELKFDFNIGDVLALNSGLSGLVTGFGIYDNQYWVESHYPDGVRLAAGNWVSEKNIIKKVEDIDTRIIVISDYIKAIRENHKEFFEGDAKFTALINQHLKPFEDILKELKNNA